MRDSEVVRILACVFIELDALKEIYPCSTIVQNLDRDIKLYVRKTISDNELERVAYYVRLTREHRKEVNAVNEKDIILESIKINDRYELRRVINGANVPYSLIIDTEKNNFELYSAPTTDEEKMLEYFREIHGKESA